MADPPICPSRLPAAADLPANASKLPAGAKKHKQTCDLHGTTASRYCNAITRNDVPCSRRAKNFPDGGFLPVCGQHSTQRIRAGRCQATEWCEHLCMRLTRYDTPFHLCNTHKGGTDTLPCYLLRLPTELRLMIFRYLFPNSIPAKKERFQKWIELGLHYPILKLCRQINTEATSVLYGEVPFHALVRGRSMYFFGRKWERSKEYGYTTFGPDVEDKISPTIARRIHRLEVEVRLGESAGLEVGFALQHGIPMEEYNLFEVRDAVRAFVKILDPKGQAFDYISDKENRADSDEEVKKTLGQRTKKVNISPVVDGSYNWDFGIIVSAIAVAIGPFKEIHGPYLPRLGPAHVCLPGYGSWLDRPLTFIGDSKPPTSIDDEQYRKYRQEWNALLAEVAGGSISQDFTANLSDFDKELDSSSGNYTRFDYKPTLKKLESQRSKARLAFQQMEQFVRFVYQQDNEYHDSISGRIRWTASFFQGLQRPFHLARVASEQLDTKAILRIKKAISNRWVNYQREQQPVLEAMANQIDGMFDLYSDEELPSSKYPDAFNFKRKKKLSNKQRTSLWEEIKIADKWPAKDNTEWIFWDDEEFEYCKRKDDTERTFPRLRLKTPAIVRAAQKSSKQT